MKIFLISDLHITREGLSDDAEIIFNKFCDCIQNESKDEIVVFVLGDIIDKGKPEAFTKALEVFREIQEKFKGKSVKFEFLPGNHDYCYGRIDEFNKFTSQIGISSNEFGTNNSYCKDYAGINFIFTDSLIHGVHNIQGEVNWDSIKTCVAKEKENVLLLHHSFFKEDDTPHGSIINSATILKDLANLGVQFFFSAHTHASPDNSFATLNIFANGSLLQDLDGMNNINNQFYIIEIDRENITTIHNCIYHGDKKRFKSNIVWFTDNLAPIKVNNEKTHEPTKGCTDIINSILTELSTITAYDRNLLSDVDYENKKSNFIESVERLDDLLPDSNTLANTAADYLRRLFKSTISNNDDEQCEARRLLPIAVKKYLDVIRECSIWEQNCPNTQFSEHIFIEKMFSKNSNEYTKQVEELYFEYYNSERNRLPLTQFKRVKFDSSVSFSHSTEISAENKSDITEAKKIHCENPVSSKEKSKHRFQKNLPNDITDFYGREYFY